MQWKAIVTTVFSAGLILGCARSASAQVQAAAKTSGIPITFGLGISRYYLDYGPGRYMEGAVGWVGADLFHGFGIDGSARSIFMGTPDVLTRMQQTTYLGGVHYTFRHIGIAHPYARMAGGIGAIEFPSGNPNYSRDTYSVMAPSGGADFSVTNHVAIRGEYEYQFWKEYHGPRYLNPQGWTIGVVYSLHAHRHALHPAS